MQRLTADAKGKGAETRAGQARGRRMAHATWLTQLGSRGANLIRLGALRDGEARRLRMRALTVEPGKPRSIRLEEVEPPPHSDGAVLVRALALGICGTDHEIIDGDYGWPPQGA